MKPPSYELSANVRKCLGFEKLLKIDFIQVELVELVEQTYVASV